MLPDQRSTTWTFHTVWTDIETVAPVRVGDTLGYAPVSTHDQNPDAQRDRLIEAGAIRVLTDIVSGKRSERPGLAELIDHARPGERLDTSSAAGELVFHVFGSIAHFERRLISERTRDSIAAARKRGRSSPTWS